MAGMAARVFVVSMVALALASCAPERTGLPTYDRAAYMPAVPLATPTPAFSWANGSPYAIIVRKRERSLTLYDHGGAQIEVYPIVLGMAPYGAKTYQGDLRTPEGVYRISGKRAHERWSRFMLLSYPNANDYVRYRTAMGTGSVPVIDGFDPGLGGEVGIHGTDRPDANIRGVDWTLGCVSMFNDHVRELYDRVPVGTPVLIEE
jgi:murein L,D-transpeptidase YafK